MRSRVAEHHTWARRSCEHVRALRPLTLRPAPLRPATLNPPLSKSDAHRALCLARALKISSAKVLPAGETLPNDVRVIAAGLDALEAGNSGTPPVHTQGERGAAQGERPPTLIDCADGGAPFRFLVTQAALTPGLVTQLTGTERLGQRPHAPLMESLRSALKVKLTEGNPWPLTVEAPADALEVRTLQVSGADSSQFASSLLLGAALVAARAKHAVKVVVTPPFASLEYLRLTERWVERTGFGLTASDQSGLTLTVSPPVAPALPEVPGDWSSLGYLLLLAWKCGGNVTRLSPPADHPDGEVVHQLASVGVTLHPDGRVLGTARGHLECSAKKCPDAILTLAAFACVLPEPSIFTDVGILRLKESDRVESLISMVHAAGGSTSLDGERLTVTPPRSLTPMKLSSRDDHRVAMSAATLAVLLGVSCELDDGDCVKKSFPLFWDELAKTGAAISR